ncbi:hypothetical protein XF14_28190 [Burkholderia gladioli]|nr:hypothetical protein XF14_28190 [Burkholderia gladioli]
MHASLLGWRLVDDEWAARTGTSVIRATHRISLGAGGWQRRGISSSRIDLGGCCTQPSIGKKDAERLAARCAPGARRGQATGFHEPCTGSDGLVGSRKAGWDGAHLMPVATGRRHCAMPEVSGTTCLQVSWTRSDDPSFPVYIRGMRSGGARSPDCAPTRASLAAISPHSRVSKPASAAPDAACVQSFLPDILMEGKATSNPKREVKGDVEQAAG